MSARTSSSAGETVNKARRRATNGTSSKPLRSLQFRNRDKTGTGRAPTYRRPETIVTNLVEPHICYQHVSSRENSCAGRYLGDEILTKYSFIAAITDWVLPALSALFAVLMMAASAAVVELVVVVVFPPVEVPVSTLR